MALEIQPKSILKRITSQIKRVRLNPQIYLWEVGMKWGEKITLLSWFPSNTSHSEMVCHPLSLFLVSSENRNCTPKILSYSKFLIFIKDSSFNDHSLYISSGDVIQSTSNIKCFPNTSFPSCSAAVKTTPVMPSSLAGSNAKIQGNLTIWQVWTER